MSWKSKTFDLNKNTDNVLEVNFWKLVYFISNFIIIIIQLSFIQTVLRIVLLPWNRCWMQRKANGKSWTTHWRNSSRNVINSTLNSLNFRLVYLVSKTNTTSLKGQNFVTCHIVTTKLLFVLSSINKLAASAAFHAA